DQHRQRQALDHALRATAVSDRLADLIVAGIVAVEIDRPLFQLRFRLCLARQERAGLRRLVGQRAGHAADTATARFLLRYLLAAHHAAAGVEQLLGILFHREI